MNRIQCLIAMSAAFCMGVCPAERSDAGVVFTFEDSSTTIGMSLDGASSGAVTVGGIQMTITANDGVFNATSSDFGINGSKSGDDTDGFNFSSIVLGVDGVAEGFTFQFDQNVLLNNFDVSSFSTGSPDMISIVSGASSIATVSTTGTTSLGDFALAANTDVTVLTTSGLYGNGWSLDFIEVSAATAVPEPSSIVLFLIVGAGVVRKRRTRPSL